MFLLYSAAVRQGIVDTVVRALSDPEVKSVVICGQNGKFCGGMDITFFFFKFPYSGGTKEYIKGKSPCKDNKHLCYIHKIITLSFHNRSGHQGVRESHVWASTDPHDPRHRGCRQAGGSSH